MNLVNRFIERVMEAPDRVAIIETVNGVDTTISYEELDLLSARACGCLKGMGIKKGDTVLVFEGMSIALYALLIGLWRLGAIAMFIDLSGGRRLLDASCRIGNPRAFIARNKAHLFRFVSSEIRKIPNKVSIGPRFLPSCAWKNFESHKPDRGIVDLNADHPALYTFTSGTTGRPKAANRTHGVLLAQHDALIDSISLEPGEVDLATLPIFALANLASGLTTVIPDCDLRRPGFVEPAKVAEQIERFRPTRCTASPTFVMRLQEYASPRGGTLPFKKVYMGGAPVFPKYLHALAQVTSDSAINVVYGSTEAEPISHVALDAISDEDFDRMRQGEGLLVGVPSPFTRVRIIEDKSGMALFELLRAEFDGLEVEQGETGEIIVSGPHVLNGYIGGEGDSENKIHVDDEVWHRTGDSGYVDSGGRLWLLGRCGSKIMVEGNAVYPFSVETAASMDERVAWSALTLHSGKRVLAVQLSEGADQFPLEELSLPQGVVDEMVFVLRMPLDRRHNAKIDYSGLVKQLRKRA